MPSRFRSGQARALQESRDDSKLLAWSTCVGLCSHYAADPYLNGTFDEFRIYDAALSASALALSYAEGPNPSFY